MKVKITFYGQTLEIVNSSEIEMEISESTMAYDIRNSLAEKYPKLSTVELKLAVNNKMIANDLKLNDSDEISILPPFSGG